ncbi:MAG: dihydroxyacetone kinase subunit DhaK [Provencibacterium sp.]|nr:dihydroxyacetone kinase subunit DhaK [Provencibacterium sp.]
MKKLQNSPETLLMDELQGYARLHRDKICLLEETTCIARRTPKARGKVKLAMGNGAGHEPAVIGWVGEGMFDLNVVGDVFTAPSGDKIFEGLQAIDDGSPILLIVQNHAGDVLNANIAMRKAKKAGMNIRQVLFYDDIASAPREAQEERRGIGGMFFYTKMVGAMAEAGADIDSCIRMFERVRENTRTYAAAFSSCTHPLTGIRMFEYLDGTENIELGMGVHGEGGGENIIPMPTAAQLAEKMGSALLSDRPYTPGDRLLIDINGAGATTCMEMNIFYNELEKYFLAQGMEIAGAVAGNFLTTQELSGISLSICKVDSEMLSLWEAPCRCGIMSR